MGSWYSPYNTLEMLCHVSIGTLFGQASWPHIDEFRIDLSVYLSVHMYYVRKFDTIVPYVRDDPLP